MTDWMRLPSGLHITAPIAIVAGVAVAAVVATLPAVWPTLSAIVSSGASADASDPLKPYLEEHDRLAEKSVKRFDGRTPFFPPPAPKAPPPPPKPPAPPEEKKDPPIEPAPAKYDGPKLTGMFGDTVYFDSTRLKVGEKHSPQEVISADSPFNIKVRYTKAGHEPGEYTLTAWEAATLHGDIDTLFPRNSVSGSSSGSASKESDTAKPAESGRPGGRRPGRDGARGGEPAASKVEAARAEAAKKAEAKGPEKGADKSAERNKSADKSETPAQGSTETPEPQTQPANGPAETPAKDGESESAVEYVAASELPAERSASAINDMSIPVAKRALQQIATTLERKDIDPHSRARLENEAKLIKSRLDKEK